jgi:hypothetical protein
LKSTVPGLVFGAGQSRFVAVGAFQSTAGGAFQLIATNDLPVGSCCSGATCTPTDQLRCAGAFTVGAACTPNPCGGACCTGAHCTLTVSASCTGSFQGLGSACGPSGNPTTCCPANFNGLGGLSVQDIFDFLAAYFGGAAGADFNHSGATSVQDIFDFLSAYFAGCA